MTIAELRQNLERFVHRQNTLEEQVCTIEQERLQLHDQVELLRNVANKQKQDRDDQLSVLSKHKKDIKDALVEASNEREKLLSVIQTDKNKKTT